ncbi:M23 family metallopeptidase [Leptothoe sp. PORK10 BA2]|uniref:M23 family metallopeptidase n=1 Tax=Leptothoe sp. PORK10 BA2 TaxID=3110254 RepID=UPI002B1EF7EA|nr:peptidoglycan DD-metalloendopeptidase family protein [Leptothoe sp. PORK10 BA2]MEA5466254.1 peptidoglycan DD-metalloendopeptidase family protein [Leptothoe sp. PORK10 BA2]
MTASAHMFIRIPQKLLLPGMQLLKIGAFAAIGLLCTQSVMAQTAVDLTIPVALPADTPAAAPAQPVIQPQPVAPVASPAPAVIAPEPVTPSRVVPPSVPTSSIEAAPEVTAPSGVPSGVSLFEGTQPADGQAPSVEVISPADYGAAPIDPTDYSVGATMPDVVISERSSGCEFSVSANSRVAGAACRQVERLATAINGISSPQSGRTVGAAINFPGVPISGFTTTASREFYNQAAQAVVKLQQGETFIFPLSMPAPLTSLFGWRMHPIFGAQRFHAGTDVGAPLGTPVVATQAGQVSLADMAGGYGLMVVLRHQGNTLESRYAHLSRLLVQAGEWVEQGEVIGLVGSTGYSTGPHLHFELRQLTADGWVLLNPDSLLNQTLGTLAQAMGNSLSAIAQNDKVATAQAAANEAATVASLQGLPFRPAQPQAN